MDYFDYATATIADAAAIASAGITYSITNNSGYSSQQGEDQTVSLLFQTEGQRLLPLFVSTFQVQLQLALILNRKISYKLILHRM